MRLLWVNGNLAYWIDIDSTTACPEPVLVTEIEEMLIDGDLDTLEDPFWESGLRIAEPGTPDWQKRENAWNIIKDYSKDVSLFQRETRGVAVRQIAETKKVTKQTVYRLLRRYWQRGMKANALLPDYYRSGGAGKKRNPGQKKLGRRRATTKGTGCNITPEIERIFRQTIESRLLKENSTSLASAFSTANKVLAVTSPRGCNHDLPTLRQFSYFYQREYSQTERIMRRTSAIDYASNIRPLTGTSTAEVSGPGARYQIDATIADVYLVSNENRGKIVGRPVIYLVIDVFSRMITGLYVGFEGPSWTSAMIALANTIIDKVAFCDSYDIEIDESDWPVHGLPERILADKGELNGAGIIPFCEAFGVTIENAPARRGDAKGIVERQFRTVQERFKPYVAGVVGPIVSRKRGGHDYRQDATMTLREFTKIIIHTVLYHNKAHVLSKYDRCPGMPENIPAVPMHLWRWGISNLTGKLRCAPSADLVQINLMPQSEATLSDSGIRLFGCFYTCSEALKLGWFIRRGDTGRPKKIKVAYDPRTADHIYVRPSNNLGEYWICDLAERSRRFRALSFWDVWAITKAERVADAGASLDASLARGDLLEKVESIARQAKQKQANRDHSQGKGLGTEIRQNKQEEKRQERSDNAYRPDRKRSEVPAEVVPIRKAKKESSYSFPDMTDLIFEDDQNDSV